MIAKKRINLRTIKIKDGKTYRNKTQILNLIPY